MQNIVRFMNLVLIPNICFVFFFSKNLDRSYFCFCFTYINILFFLSILNKMIASTYTYFRIIYNVEENMNTAQQLHDSYKQIIN